MSFFSSGVSRSAFVKSYVRSRTQSMYASTVRSLFREPYVVGHVETASTIVNPFTPSAFSIILSGLTGSVTEPRATNAAPRAVPSATMSNGVSTLPYCAVDAMLPTGVVGEYWPPVMP